MLQLILAADAADAADATKAWEVAIPAVAGLVGALIGAGVGLIVGWVQVKAASKAAARSYANRQLVELYGRLRALVSLNKKLAEVMKYDWPVTTSSIDPKRAEEIGADRVRKHSRDGIITNNESIAELIRDKGGLFYGDHYPVSFERELHHVRFFEHQARGLPVGEPRPEDSFDLGFEVHIDEAIKSLRSHVQSE